MRASIGIVSCLALIVALSGCRVGPSVTRSLKPTGPSGRLTLTSRTAISGLDSEPVLKISVEVLSLDEAGLFALSDGRVIRVAYDHIRTLDLKGFRPQFVKKDQNAAQVRSELMSTESGRKIHYLSRFPQGVTPELLEALLAAYRQETLFTIP